MICAKPPQSPGFLVGVLDFFMGFEPTLLKFAEKAKIDPQDIATRRQFWPVLKRAW